MEGMIFFQCLEANFVNVNVLLLMDHDELFVFSCFAVLARGVMEYFISDVKNVNNDYFSLCWISSALLYMLINISFGISACQQ